MLGPPDRLELPTSQAVLDSYKKLEQVCEAKKREVCHSI